MTSLLSLVLLLSPIALLLLLAWRALDRRACFEETVNRTMPVVDGVRQPPPGILDDDYSAPFDRVVRRHMRATVRKLQGDSGEDLPAWE